MTNEFRRIKQFKNKSKTNDLTHLNLTRFNKICVFL